MTTPAPGSLGALGEFGLIAEVTARLTQGRGVVVGPGDDAAVVATPDNRVVITTDLLVEGRHFRRDWSSATDVGHKAAAQSLADVAAMGARPTALVVGLGAPPEVQVSWAVEMADGVQAECGPLRVSVVGGDVVASDQITLAVTALGDLEGRAPILRGGAKVGDVVAYTGRLGWAAAGMAILQRGFRSPKVLVDAHRRPEPPYAMGPRAAAAGARAMCDVSDGLLQDLGHVAKASGVGIDLSLTAFSIAEPMAAAAAALGVDPLGWVLQGGEDHALAATFPPGTRRPRGWTVIGTVVEGPVAEGAGVVVDGELWAGPGGHDHFA